MSVREQAEESAPGVRGNQTGSRWWQRILPWVGGDALWYGVAALVLGLHAQSLLTPNGLPDPTADTAAATRWYGLAVAVLLIGWWGTYQNLSLFVPVPTRLHGLRAWIGERPDRRRIAAVTAAVLTNLLAILLLRGNWSSLLGGVLWAASLVALVAAYRQRKIAWTPHWRATGWTRTRLVEAAVLALILAVALVLRVWKLGALGPGMHGDEGEAGTQGLAILNGNLVSPFLRGWFNQSNFYYWSLAIFMRVFGTGLFGLRTFAAFCGLLTVLLVYLLGREMFGSRTGLIAASLMAFQSASLIFSRQEFSNVTVPPLEAATFYFLVRGLRTKHMVDWVMAGYAAGLAFYYFAGGRLIAPVAVLFLLYLAAVHRGFLREYWTRSLAFGLALIAIITPFVAYYVANPLPTNTYPNDRFIWLHHDDLAALYGSPAWGTILWGQLTRTVSILTHTTDASAMGALDFPIARPLEAVFIVLGLGWALLRWRDSRFALLSLWFWSSILVGGVLTTEAPNLPRILGILPVLPLLAATILDHFWTQITDAATHIGETPQWTRYGQVIGSVLVGGTIVISGIQNKHMYIDRYLGEHTNTLVTGQAAYVRHGGTGYFYYDLGAPVIYWTHGDNRFINPHALGEDGVNLSGTLPITDNGPQANMPANFLVWPIMADYLRVLEAYYPGGTVKVVRLGDAEHLTDPLIGYVLSPRLIDARRTLLAQYRSVHAGSITRREPRLGLPTGVAPPPGLHYPVQARWTGAIVAPSFGTYRFRLTGARNVHLRVDGVSLSGTDGALLLGGGVHTVQLTATLPNARTHVTVLWANAAHGFQQIPRRYLWDGHIGRALVGDVQPVPGPGGAVVIGETSQRIDGFLGFRSSGLAFGLLSGARVHWSGTLHITTPGEYTFQVDSFGSASLRIDGSTVVNNVALGPGPSVSEGRLHLDSGPHRVGVRYLWNSGVGYLEVRWQPPNAPLQLLVTPQLQPDQPGARRVPVASLPLGPSHPVAEPVTLLPTLGKVLLPRGLDLVGVAVGRDGHLIVADGRTRRILVLDHKGNVLSSWGGPGKLPGQFQRVDDLAVGPTGEVYVLDSAIPRIQGFSPRGTLTTTIDGRGTWCSPRGMDVTGTGRIVVADTCHSSVDVYSSQGDLQLITKGDSRVGRALDQPIDVVAGPDGSLYVADLRQRLVRLDPGGQIAQTWPVAVSAAATFTHLALSRGTIYVTAPGASTLTAVTPLARRPVTVEGPSGGSGAIAAGPAGRLYVLGAERRQLTVLLARPSVVR